MFKKPWNITLKKYKLNTKEKEIITQNRPLWKDSTLKKSIGILIVDFLRS
jgi:hypothetical protein